MRLPWQKDEYVPPTKYYHVEPMPIAKGVECRHAWTEELQWRKSLSIASGARRCVDCGAISKWWTTLEPGE